MLRWVEVVRESRHRRRRCQHRALLHLHEEKYPTAKIIAFEPAPESFATLHRNFELNGISGVEAHQCGLGPAASAEKLTFYPTFPGNSTLRPETKKSTYEAIAERFGQEFVDTNFGNPQFLDIKIERLSWFLDGVERIDLLKVDVEGSELGVLQGVNYEHWKFIRNIVLETTESSGDRQKIEDLLRQKGFKVVREGAAFDSNMEFFVIRGLGLIERTKLVKRHRTESSRPRGRVIWLSTPGRLNIICSEGFRPDSSVVVLACFN